MSPFIKAENQVSGQKEADYLPCPTSHPTVYRSHRTGLKERILPPKQASKAVPQVLSQCHLDSILQPRKNQAESKVISPT